MNQFEQSFQLEGGLPEYLLTSCGRRFIRCYSKDDGSYAEYFLETPDELHTTTSEEMITVTKQVSSYTGVYQGQMFKEDIFRTERGI